MFLIPALVFVGVLATIVGAYTIFVVRPERQIAGRLQPPQSVVREAGLAREDAMASTPLLHRLLERIKPFALPAQRFVDQSRLPMTTASFLLATGCLARGGYLLALFGFRTVWIALPVGLLAGFQRFWLARGRPAGQHHKIERHRRRRRDFSHRHAERVAS